MPHIHLQGVNFPRWRFNGEAVFADMIQTEANGYLNLESGARVQLTDDLANSGPHGYGDFVVVKADENGMTDDVSLVPGAVFTSSAAKIPHALDVPQVSADPQAGRQPGEPLSGDPAEPMAQTAAKDDPIATMHEQQAADYAAEKNGEAKGEG